MSTVADRVNMEMNADGSFWVLAHILPTTLNVRRVFVSFFYSKWQIYPVPEGEAFKKVPRIITLCVGQVEHEKGDDEKTASEAKCDFLRNLVSYGVLILIRQVNILVWQIDAHLTSHDDDDDEDSSNIFESWWWLIIAILPHTSLQ